MDANIGKSLSPLRSCEHLLILLRVMKTKVKELIKTVDKKKERAYVDSDVLGEVVDIQKCLIHNFDNEWGDVLVFKSVPSGASFGVAIKDITDIKIAHHEHSSVIQMVLRNEDRYTIIVR